MDYEALGLKAGIEIHQQLNTKEKLFCHCPTQIRDVEEHSGEFFRYLRATQSELGEIDRAAKEEMMQVRKFQYLTYDTTCLVENDEEPPAPLNSEALEIVLTISKMFKMTYIPQIHTMRKLVIDGSNTSGFQRTAMVATDGLLPNNGKIETVCVEEEAAQRVEDGLFSLDRLGIPLIEITTSPCMHTPEDVQNVAAYIGMILRSTGRVKRGIGTIRQDINISIRDGARVEIKGVQELDLIKEVVKREVIRQVKLLEIKAELKKRGASVGAETHDVTELFKNSESKILKRAKQILAIRLKGFSGLVGTEIQPGRRLGSEMSDYAKKCGVGGLFHTDELPAYGVTETEVEALKKACSAGKQDCVIIVADSPRKCECALKQIMYRAELAFEGVPEETRKMLEEGSTAYMRPLPGAARMYPETDIMPLQVDDLYWEELKIPELLSHKTERYEADFGFDPYVAKNMAYSEYSSLFELAVAEGINPNLATRTLLATLKELSRDGVPVDRITHQQIFSVLKLVKDGKAAKEAIPDVLTLIAEGKSVEEAAESVAPGISEEELTAIIQKIISDRAQFISERGMASIGPLMGVVMQEVRGSVDGKMVNQILKREISKSVN